MIQFNAAPAVPITYPRLSSLTSEEITKALSSGYVAETTNLMRPVKREGLNNYMELRANDDMQDWRTRMYVIWFCYIYENFHSIQRPLYAIEELVIEFQGQNVIDTPTRRIASLYAGAGAADSISEIERKKSLEKLEPHYVKAITLLDGWNIESHKWR